MSSTYPRLGGPAAGELCLGAGLGCPAGRVLGSLLCSIWIWCLGKPWRNCLWRELPQKDGRHRLSDCLAGGVLLVIIKKYCFHLNIWNQFPGGRFCYVFVKFKSSQNQISASVQWQPLLKLHFDKKKEELGCFCLTGRAAGLAMEQPVTSLNPLKVLDLVLECGGSAPVQVLAVLHVGKGLFLFSFLTPPSTCPAGQLALPSLEAGRDWAVIPSSSWGCYPATGNYRQAFFRSFCLSVGWTTVVKTLQGTVSPGGFISMLEADTPERVWQSHQQVLVCVL